MLYITYLISLHRGTIYYRTTSRTTLFSWELMGAACSGETPPTSTHCTCENRRAEPKPLDSRPTHCGQTCNAEGRTVVV